MTSASPPDLEKGNISDVRNTMSWGSAIISPVFLFDKVRNNFPVIESHIVRQGVNGKKTDLGRIISGMQTIAKEIKQKYDEGFFFAWKFKCKYTKKELIEAKLFHLKIKTEFEPTGKKCRTLAERSEERRVGKECRSRWSQYH